MTRVEVHVEHDHLEKLTRPSPRLAGVSELIWNAVDAEANRVSVRVFDNALQGVDAVEVVDDGHGMERAQALHDFELLGGSWKRYTERSKNGKRLVHGSEGQGRWRAFSIGDQVKWISVSEHDGKRSEVTIAGNRAKLTEFEVSEAQATDDAVGTRVVIENIRQGVAGALLDERAIDHLNAEFALYAQMYPDVEILYRGFRVDPAALTKHRAEYALTVEGVPGSIELIVIEWKRDVRRALLLCDESGMTLGELQPGIQAPAFHFTAYIRWAGFREHEPELAVAELHPSLQPVIEAAKDRLREHFKDRQAEVQAEVVREWKEEQVYPYEGEATSPTERVERDVFDVVALTAARAVNATSDRVSRKLSLSLLKQALEQSPGALNRVLGEVLDLSQERLRELDELLKQTTLAAIISAARVVADRLDFLRSLDVLLFDLETKRALLERSQLHKILARETWIFGDEYTLAVDDEGLGAVLEKHIHLLGRAKTAEDLDPVRLEDGSRAIIDLLLSATVPLPTKQRAHLVVELKRPSVTLGHEELLQIQRYADAVARDARFDKVDVTWNFWLIGTKMSEFVQGAARQPHLPPGIVSQPLEGKVTVWAKTWSQIIDDCEHRLKFVRDNLEYHSTTDSAIEYLQRAHERFLPATLAAPPPEPEAPSEGAEGIEAA